MSWNVLRLGALPFPNIVPDVDPRDSKVPLEVWLVGAVPRDRRHRRRHPDRRRAVALGRGEEFWGIFASLAFDRLSLDVVWPQPLWRGDGRLRSSPAFERTGLPYRSYMREIDMTNGSTLFSEKPEGLPVFEGRMIDACDYRAKGYVGGRGRAAEWRELPFGDTRKAILPQWRIPQELAPNTRLSRIGQYRIGYGWVASPTNERSLVAALIPPNTMCVVVG